MRIRNLMLKALCAVALVASVSVSCSEVSFIEINPPADLQEKIDSIQAVKDAANAALGDRTPIDITSAVVGLEDCTTPWWAHFSDYFAVPTNKRLVVKFTNHGSLKEIYHNWILVVTNPNERATTNYAEYFALRADAHAWAGAGIANLESTFDIAMLKHNYADVYSTWDPANADCKAAFLADMNGAEVVLEIDHAKAGVVFVTATATSADGSTVLVETYEQKVSATEDIWAFVLFEGAYGELHEAYLEPSKIEEIPDEVASSITVTGTPSAIEVGSKDFWGKGVATVTYADGSSAPVDTADVNFVVPDLSTPGVKTIILSYSKTKQGNYGPSVIGTYDLEVTNPIVAVEASATAYFIGGAKYLTLSPGAVKVVATFGDGSKAPLKSSQVEVAFKDDKVLYEAVAGTYADAFTVTYTTASGEILSDVGDLVIAASALPAQDTPVGAEDFTNVWWSTFTQDWAVAPYESQTVSMTLASAAAGNFQSPCTILRKADMSEYGVLRMDHYGWGTSVGDACALITATSNWNWDTFLTILNGSQIAITVSNHGDNTASVRYHIVSNNGETHFQYYDNIAIDSADFQFALVTEGSYLIFD